MSSAFEKFKIQNADERKEKKLREKNWKINKNMKSKENTYLENWGIDYMLIS